QQRDERQAGRDRRGDEEFPIHVSDSLCYHCATRGGARDSSAGGESVSAARRTPPHLLQCVTWPVVHRPQLRLFPLLLDRVHRRIGLLLDRRRGERGLQPAEIAIRTVEQGGLVFRRRLLGDFHCVGIAQLAAIADIAAVDQPLATDFLQVDCGGQDDDQL